jgi:D-lactate dehydrogenase
MNDIFATAKPFSDFSPRARELLSQAAERRSFEAGQTVFAEGDPAEWAFVVESGLLQASKRSRDGVEVGLRELRSGDAGGLTAVAYEARRSASMRALERSVLVILPKAQLARLAREMPEISSALLGFLGNKVRSKTSELATLLARTGRDPREQIAFFDAKPYDEAAFVKRLPQGLRIRFHEARLGPSTVALADGFPVVCAFVNDDLSAPVLEQLKAGGVQLIAMRCAGYNNVDLEAAEKLGLTVVRVPAYSPHAIAEHAAALILTLNRKTHRAFNRVREGNFRLGGLVGFDLYGRTAGIVGLGKIGRCLAEALRGFGMKVLAYDAHVDEELAKRIGVTYVGLDQLLRESDIVSLHAPLTPETRHLIDAKRIATMKRGVMLINTSRGALVDTAALIDALKSGHIGAAGLDVYEEESEYFFEDRSNGPISDDLLARLTTFNNVLVTSHQAFLTEDALDNIAQTTLQNIEDYRRGQRGRELANVLLAG